MKFRTETPLEFLAEKNGTLGLNRDPGVDPIGDHRKHLTIDKGPIGGSVDHGFKTDTRNVLRCARFAKVPLRVEAVE